MENIGQVIQITGPAVDVQFTETKMPPIYQALKVVSDGFKVPNPVGVILEVRDAVTRALEEARSGGGGRRGRGRGPGAASCARRRRLTRCRTRRARTAAAPHQS